MTTLINFGVIGTGQMAATMMEAFKHLSDVKVLAVASESVERAQSFATKFNVPKAYQGVDELLSDQALNAVYIANATESHAVTTIKALKAGKAVLCEKPIATTEAENKLIELQASSAGKLCMEAMWTHFLPAYQRLFELSSSGKLGKPTHLYADFGYPVNINLHPRLFKFSAGCGVLLDRGVYPIALAIKLFGGVKQLNALVEYNQDDVDTHASLLLAHQNGAQSQLAVSFNSLLQNKAVLSFTGGSASIEPPLIGAETVSYQSFQVNNRQHPNATGFKNSLKQQLKQSALLRRIKSKKNTAHINYCSYGVNQYLPVLRHFCDLLRLDKLQSEVIPLNLSGEVLSVIERAKNMQMMPNKVIIK